MIDFEVVDLDGKTVTSIIFPKKAQEILICADKIFVITKETYDETIDDDAYDDLLALFNPLRD